jgi:nucleoside 2-deoxyribosyltransferase
MFKIYLAGPDVFTRDPMALADRKKALCAQYGFEGVFPLDNALDLSSLTPYEMGLRISAANEGLMRACNLVIAHMTPFRGPGMDGGTAYEMGYMRALGKPVFGYMNVYQNDGDADPKHLANRVRTYYADKKPGRAAEIVTRADGHTLEDSLRHLAVENFDMADNLMMEGAVYFSGGSVVVTRVPEAERYTNLTGFELCLQQAKALLKP